jgi:hypothetical protein
MNRFAVPAAIALACSLLLLQAAKSAETAPTTKVVILGTYHMGNPSRDVENSTVDDVLSDKRQKEIAEVVAKLARFNPTVVAVESAGAGPNLATPKYHEYLDGKLAASRNEVVQIGFRLARDAGLKEVSGVDVKGDIPMEPLQAYAQKNGQADVIGAAMAPVQREMQAFDTLLGTASVSEALQHMNDPGFVRSSDAFYRQMLRVGRGTEQPGANLVNAWQDRNTQICARLMQVTKPGDRAVVVFGAGHGYLLRQCVLQMPGYELVEASTLLK